MSSVLSVRWQAQRVPEFDRAVALFEHARVSYTEAETLKRDFWDAGEDARLREDDRFQQTAWGRWTLANRELINDALFVRMQSTPETGLALNEAFDASNPQEIFCRGDKRFILKNGIVFLAGQRDLTSDEGRERITTRLREARLRIFEAQPIEREIEPQTDATSWQSSFVCLENEAGGLHLEAGPMAKLPSFVKRFVITAGAQSWQAMASNFRNRCWRVAVQPGPDSYCWASPGHVDLVGDDLALLILPGLSATTATVFRIDAAGVGRLLAEPALNPGQGYRLLVPPALASVELKPGRISTLRDGWRLWDLDIASDPEMDLRSQVEKLGLSLGESAPQVRWVITPPVAYQETPRGESHPCFETGSMPTLRITTEVAVAEGDLTGFLLVGDDLRSFPLPAGKEFIVELGALPVGRYVVDVLHRSTRISPQRLPFTIADCKTLPIEANVNIRLRSQQQSFDAAGRMDLGADLGALEPDALDIVGPPLWQVQISWDGGRRQRLESMSLGSDGRLDSSELLSRTQELRRRDAVGDLLLDFGELGQAIVRHDRQPNPKDLRHKLARLMDERATTLAGLGGQFLLLRSLWLDPVLILLGYEIVEPLAADLADAPALTTVLLLQATMREAGRIFRRVRWTLILTAHPADLRDDQLRSFADRLCGQRGVSEALLTDGVRWTRHKGGSRLRARSWDLKDLVVPEAEADFENFIFEFGV